MTRLSRFSSKFFLTLAIIGTAFMGSLASPGLAQAQSAPPVQPPPSRPFGAKPLPWKLGAAGPVAPSTPLVPPPALANNWSNTSPFPGFQAATMFLLTDGRVLVQDIAGTNWYTLTPDSSGSYVTGTWNSLGSTPRTCFDTLTQVLEAWEPIYFASAVLPDGRVVMIGGEYNNAISSDEVWSNIGQIYDPAANTWTCLSAPSGWNNIGDASSAVLPSGTFLLADGVGTAVATLNLTTNPPSWTVINSAGSKNNDANGYNNEEGWTLLPNGNVLTLEIWNSLDTTETPADEWSPSMMTWISAGIASDNLVLLSSGGTEYFEIGPAVLRPDGTVFATGATGKTAIYNTNTTTWSVGPTLPTVIESFSCNSVNYTNVTEQFALADAPAALLPDGNVLLSASPVDPNCGWISGTEFFEFNGSTLTQVAGSAFASTDASFYGKMLTLPTGQILFTDGGGEPQIYTESSGTPNSAWAPTITASPATAGVGAKNLIITGTQFNGLSQAVAYGDDYQAATNYPLVRITNLATSHVFYARTHGHSSMGVATGSAAESTLFDLPGSIETGNSTLVVVANGIASTSVPIDILIPGSTALASSLNPSNSGQSVTFTATVTGTSGTPTGMVTFYDGATSLAANLGTFTLNGSGVTTLATSTLAIGTHTITAQYNGNSTYGPTTSAAVLQVVKGQATTTALVSSVNPSTNGQGVQFSATITPTGSGTPTGTLTYLDANSSLDGNTVLGTVTLSGGVAPVLSVSSLLVGTHSVTAQYSGDSVFSASTSNAVSQQVNYPVPTLTTLGTTSVTAGSAGFNLTVNGTNFVNGAKVNFNGSTLTTTFKSSTQLTAAVLAANVAAAGTYLVTATNPTPGGGTSNSLNFTVNNPLPAIVSLSPNTATAGGAGFTLTVNGSGFVTTSAVNFNGTAESTTFVSSAQIKGTIPTAAIAAGGTFPVTVMNPAPAGGTSNSVNFTVTGGSLTVTLATLPSGVANVAYPSTTISAGGGTAPYTWTTSPVVGTLPPGLSFSAAGVITGTPTTAGTYPFTLKVTDSATNTATGAFSITVNAALKVTLATLPTGAVNGAYPSTNIIASGGLSPYTWTTAPVSGSFPPELSLSATGALSGTPTTAGTYPFTVKVTDANSSTATGAFSITINAPLTVTLGTLPTGLTNAAYPSTTFAATGGVPNYTWTTAPVSGNFPPGLSLSAAGVLSGTPTTAGTYPFTVKVTDSNSDIAMGAFSITINASLAITTTGALPSVDAGVIYSAPLVATGGTPPYTWALTSGTLPAGLSLAPGTGIISGTPAASEIGTTSTFTVKATDANSLTATSTSLSIAIGGVAIMATTPNPVTQGSSTTSTVTLNALNGFNGTAALMATFTSMPSNAVLPVLTFTPSSTLNLGSMTTQSTTINIATTAASSVLFRPPTNLPFHGNWPWAAAAASLGGFFFLLLGVPAQKKWGFAPLAVLLFVIVAAGVGCGPVNTNQGGSSGGTTKGTYTITVTATPAPGGAQANQTTTITLTVM